VHQRDGFTLVSGSTYLFDMQVARFFSTLPPFELAEELLPPPSPDVALANPRGGS
jgi:hypothetical protein